jgi:predicted nucleic acid-binding protein
MIQLDTNFLIQALVPGSAAEQSLQAWLTNGEDVGIGAIAWSEFLCGPLPPGAEALAQALLAAPEPFLATDARKAADLFDATGRRSRSLADCQIAAVALRCGASVATGNASDFAPFTSHGLVLA